MFKTDLVVKALTNRPNYWEVVRELVWQGPIKDKTPSLDFVVFVGFVTDLASIPRPLRWLINPNGKSRRAAVLHDFLYTGQHLSRKEGDKVLRYIISGVASTGASQSGNWNRRYRENCSRLRSGGIYGIADVFIFLKHKQQEKGLSASEQKMLSLTMRLLREELLCIGCAEEEVYGAIS